MTTNNNRLPSRRTILAAGLVAGALPLALGSAMPAAAQDVLKIGAVLPLSGPAARIGKENQEGILLALDEYGGKIGNKTVQFVFADDQFNPNAGLAETRRLVENEKVVAVVGTLNSAVALAIHPYTTRMKMPYVTGGIATDLTTTRKSPYTFRSSLASGQMEGPLALFLSRKGWKSGILMGSDYAAGRDAVKNVGDNMKLLGGTVTDEIFPRAGETDYAPFFSRIADKKADFVFGYFFGGDTLRFIRAYRSFGLKYPLVITTSAISAGGVANALGESVNGLMSVELWMPTQDDPASKAFVAAYTKKFGYGPESLSYDGYIKGKVVLEALKALGGNVTDGTALAEAMKKVKFAAPGGEFRYDDNNNPIVNARFVEWKWDGTKAVPTVTGTIEGISQDWKPTK